MNQTNVRETVYNRPFIRQRADPYLLRRGDGSYYFTASVPEYDRIVLRHASSLSGLRDAEEKILWVKHDAGPQSIHIWAPELHEIDGTFYMYYAGGDKDDIWEIRPYVLRCAGDPMADPWEELGPLQAADGDDFSFRAFSLDATVFFHHGSRYCVWAEKVGVGKQISNLYIARMESPVKLASIQTLLTTPDYGWERGDFWVNEGPAVLRHDGKLFLTFSANTTGELYCMGMLWADEDSDLLDPANWTKLRRPLLQSDAEKGIYGPGHNCFVKAEDGVTDLCVFHARQYRELVGNPLYDPNRHVYIMPVVFDADGLPALRYVPQEW